MAAQAAEKLTWANALTLEIMMVVIINCKVMVCNAANTFCWLVDMDAGAVTAYNTYLQRYDYVGKRWCC